MKTFVRVAPAAALVLLVAACAGGPPPPIEEGLLGEPCGFCRMVISERPFAAQIVSRSDEPVFFDDIGCLRDYLAGGGKVGRGAMAYVNDHRTGAWVPAGQAIYTRVPTLATPMGSHLVAHANEASRQDDPVTQFDPPRTAAEVFAGARVPGGSDAR